MPDSRLLFTFAANPSPVRVSIGGTNPVPSLIDLLVTIDNSSSPIMVSKIEIEIPVGESGPTGGNRLSTALPADASYDQQRDWKIEVKGSTVTITPASNKPTPPPKSLTSAIMFKLKGIKVNEFVGSVPITVTQKVLPLPGTLSYQIDKLPADFPVKRFYITRDDRELDPPVLSNLDQRVVLKWECTDQGKQTGYSYNVRTDDGSWFKKGGLSDDDCLSWQDGVNGVETPRIRETTTFALDIIRTEGTTRSIHKTLYITVRVAVPHILEDSYYQDLYFSGSFARLGWIAVNAVKCTVELDGEVIDDNAPLDTYEDGYQVILPFDPGTRSHEISVTARGAPGTRSNRRAFPNVFVQRLITIPVGFPATRIAVTPDGTRALVVGDYTGRGGQGIWGNLKIIDIATGNTEDVVMDWAPLGDGGLAISPDGTSALVSVQNGISKIDITNKRSNFVAGASICIQIAFANDSILAFHPEGGVIRFANILQNPIPYPTLKLLSPNIFMEPARWYSCMATSTDGKLAFVGGDSLNVIDIEGWAWKGPVGWSSEINSGFDPFTDKPGGRWINDGVAAIANTPNGALVLAITLRGLLLIIDARTQVVTKMIQLHPPAQRDRQDLQACDGYAIAISSDSTLACIAVPGKPIDVFDISKGAILTSFVGGDDPRHIAITPDGRRLLVANYASQSVTMTAIP